MKNPMNCDFKICNCNPQEYGEGVVSFPCMGDNSAITLAPYNALGKVVAIFKL